MANADPKAHTVLVVEDNPVVRDLITLTLRRIERQHPDVIELLEVGDGATAWETPAKPPTMNRATKPTEKSNGVFKSMDPPQSVAIQLNILTPVGTAISIVVTVNTVLGIGPNPTVNMWWLQTAQPIMPMTIPENTTTGYPNSGLRENVGNISETIPMAGRIRM